MISLYEISMCDLICDVITCCVWSSDTSKIINASDKITFENQKRDNMEIKEIFT